MQVAEHSLKGFRILVAEDEYLLAENLCEGLTDAGAVIIGPVGTLKDLLAKIEMEAEIDGAVLDVNMRGEMVFSAADKLIERGVPFVFTTGYDASCIPGRYNAVTCCMKPILLSKLTQAIAGVIHHS